jgi:hypothetical protein
VFAPTAQSATFRVLLTIAARENLQIRQLGVKTDFLDGELSKEPNLKLPTDLGGGVKKQRRALYGLGQAAREWHAKVKYTLVGGDFQASYHYPCQFMKGTGSSRALL